MDLLEVRHYQPGDDPRTLDWRVTARTGKPHTKVFHEEQERTLFLVVDMGKNMRFASRCAFKSVLAARAAALFAWAALLRKDRVGGLLLNGSYHQEIRPKLHTKGLSTLFQAIVATHDVPATSMTEWDQALARLWHLTRPGTRLIWLSDFASVTPQQMAQLPVMARHLDMIWVVIQDPLELEPPPPGNYLFCEGEKLFLFNSTQQHDAYRQRWRDHWNNLRESCQQAGGIFIPLKTTDDLAETLQWGIHAYWR